MAVVLGQVSGGLACRDFDVEDAYVSWRENHPQLADSLPTSRTRRGYHVLFIADPGDPDLPSRGVRKLADDELRVRGCHVTLPPNVHPDGGHYEWIREPFHGIPRVYSAAATGLIAIAPQSLIRGAGAPTCDTYQYRPMQYQKGGALCALYGEDGSLQMEAFDELLAWTLPTGPGMRDNCLWSLASVLKTLDETRWLRIDELQPLVRQWWRLAARVIRTKDWAITWGAFVRAWERAMPCSNHAGILTEALAAARHAGCPPELFAEFGDRVGGLAAALCRELAARSPDGTFFLGYRSLAWACGINPNEAGACLKALCASRVIRQLEPYQMGRATVYQYLRSLHPNEKTERRNT